MLARLLLLGALLVASGVAADNDVEVNVSGDDAISSGLKTFLRLYSECDHKDGIAPCLKMRAITFFDRALKMKDIPLSDSLVLVKTGSDEIRIPVGRSFSESKTEVSEDELDNLLFDRVARFFNSHNVQIILPRMDDQQLQRSIEEGRGKMKKMMGSMMMVFGMKMMALIPIAIGGLFLLAGKALIISKIALVLTLIIALKKLLAQKQDHGHHESHGWQSSGGGGGGWDRRSLEAIEAAHKMAYRGQVGDNTVVQSQQH
uniref:Osiris 5 n=1 Tax=Timema bartmani TaxID=61472 RepID=A0A7R9I4Y5_9NEOP|nr:unnamed protein product [Timema bartmani]